MVTRETISQRNDIKKEIEDIRKEIKKVEDGIEKLLNEGTVVDKVKGGLGGIQGFKIEGLPEKEYKRREKILRNKYDRLTEKENDLLELNENIETFVDRIPVSRDRRIFKALYFEGKTQQQIANELNIDRSLVSKIISKYF